MIKIKEAKCPESKPYRIINVHSFGLSMHRAYFQAPKLRKYAKSVDVHVNSRDGH